MEVEQPPPPPMEEPAPPEAAPEPVLVADPAPPPPPEVIAPPPVPVPTVNIPPSSAMLASLANSIMSSASSGMNFPMEVTPSRVIQVTNIAPQATRDQMLTLFTFIGRVEDIRLYPSVRDASIAVSARVCFIKFNEFLSVGIAQHLNNTVFIDRAIIITPISGNEVPDEVSGLVMAQNNNGGASNTNKPGGIPGVPEARKMPSNMINRLEGMSPAAFIMTHDARLVDAGLPLYPPLPANTAQERVEEIRRTVCVVGLDSTVSAQACMEAFSEAGEVKYFRYCTRQSDSTKYALVEFSEHASVVPALRQNDRQLGLSQIKVTHATTAITKPQAKSNEAAQREIEEAMHKVKEAQSLVSATVDPLMGMLHAGSGAAAALIRASMPRSRSRSRGRHSRERSRYSSRRSRSRDRRRRTRSRSRSRDRRRRSRSRDRHRRRRSRTRSRDRKRRSRSRDRKRDKDRKKDEKDKEIKKEGENGEEKAPAVEESNGKTSTSVEKKEKRRSKSRDRKRSRSRDRKRSKRSRSRSRDRRRRSRSKDRDRRRDRDRSKSKDKKSGRKDKIKEEKDSKTKVSRDYDQEEAGFEDGSSASGKQKQKNGPKPPDPIVVIEAPPPPPPKGEDDMDISNSP